MNDWNVTFENNRAGPLYTAKFKTIAFVWQYIVLAWIYLFCTYWSTNLYIWGQIAMHCDSLKNLVSRGPDCVWESGPRETSQNRTSSKKKKKKKKKAEVIGANWLVRFPILIMWLASAHMQYGKPLLASARLSCDRIKIRLKRSGRCRSMQYLRLRQCKCVSSQKWSLYTRFLFDWFGAFFPIKFSARLERLQIWLLPEPWPDLSFRWSASFFFTLLLLKVRQSYVVILAIMHAEFQFACS